jgi:hypothetical protein
MASSCSSIRALAGGQGFSLHLVRFFGNLDWLKFNAYYR